MRNSRCRLLLWPVLAGVLLSCYGISPSSAAEQTKSGGTPPAAAMNAPDMEKGKGVVWYPYEDGLARAKAENKKTFLFFYTNKCHYCRVMETNTFTNGQVIAMLNKNFISVKVDMDNKAAMKSTYHIIGVPTSWFLESGGEQIGSQPGYIPPEDFTKMLQFVLSGQYK